MLQMSDHVIKHVTPLRDFTAAHHISHRGPDVLFSYKNTRRLTELEKNQKKTISTSPSRLLLSSLLRHAGCAKQTLLSP